MSDERPWEDYADPVSRTETAPVVTGNSRIDEEFSALNDPNVGYGEDIAKGAVGGLGRGLTGLAGMGGNIGNLTRAGLSKLGVSDENLNRGASVARTLGMAIPAFAAWTGPDSNQIQKYVEGVTGKFYQPSTIPGQYASTIAEFAPSAAIPGGGGIGARVLNTVVPALASETAGQFTKGTAAEPWARGVAGLVAGPAAAKVITPTAPATASRQAATAVLDREGIPLTAGQRTGSKTLQWLESNAADMPGSAGRAAEMNSAQANAVDRAITEKIYDPAELRSRGVPEGVNLPDPRAVVAGKQSLSDKYTDLTSRNQLRSDPQLQKELLDAQTRYENLALPSQKSKDVEAVRNSIVDSLLQGQGSMAGDLYQAKRSQLGTIAKGLQGDPYKAAAFKDMRSALDAAMQRGLSPADAEAWALNNQRWGNMKQLEPAVASAGENLSPARVAQTARAGRAGQYAAQSSDLDQLAKAASTVIKPMPNSGTAARTGMQHLFNIPQLLTSGGTAAAGSLLGPLGAAAGAAAPFVLPRMALSKVGQAYLGNQLMPQNARDIVAQTITQQALSHPSSVARNRSEADAYEQKRKYELSRIGLL